MAIVGLISTLMEQLLTAINNEADYAFLHQFEVLRTRFRLINAFLAQDDFDNRTVVFRSTLDDFREMMYETDDLLTDCLIGQNCRKIGLCSKLSPRVMYFRLQMVRKLKDINARLEEVEKILSMYFRAKESPAEVSSSSAKESINKFSRWDYGLSDEIVVGVEKDLDTIKTLIFSSDDTLQMVGIVGMGGLGKTTIARLIFNDPKVHHHFHKCIWVSVSQNFSVEAILKSILGQLGEREECARDANYALYIIFQMLKNRACLIILDDIWEQGVEWWRKFFSLMQRSGCERSCVIITTRNEDVAYAIGVDRNRIHRPNILNESDSWSLFTKLAFGMNNDISYDEHYILISKFLNQCSGLPLAIKAIGGLLRSTHNLVEWHAIFKKFCEPNINAENSIAINSLLLSYKELPPHLKGCLLSLSVYPLDFEIQAEDLIYCWIGEGLVRGIGSKTAMEKGFKYLSQLVSRCLVEVVGRRGYDGRVQTFKMHNLVRELTLAMAKEEQICSFDNQGKQELTRNCRWLGFTGYMDAKSLNRCPKLRVLLLMNGDQAYFDMKLGSLRVLDLSNNKLDRLAFKNLLSWISSLKRLAFLNLSGTQGLIELPDSIRKLQNLQILVLSRCTRLLKLSPSITYLKNLLVLDVSGCDSLSYLPCRLASLSQLQELSGLKLGGLANKRSCRFLEVGELCELRILRMILVNDSAITEAESDVLSKLRKLEILAIDAQDYSDKRMQEMLDQLWPPPALKELYLMSYRHYTLPKWVSPDFIPTLQYLSITYGDLEDFHLSTDNYWRLEGLTLNSLPRLRTEWNHLRQKMSLLRYVEVSNCPRVVDFPSQDSGCDKVIWQRNDDDKSN